MYQHRIAFLEDSDDLREEVCFLLRAEGFQIEGFGAASVFLNAHKVHPYEVLLLDLGLPDRDGMAVAQELSNRGDDIGIIMLTARGGLSDRVEGLMVGADAYLVKPFEMAEVSAHLAALIRRKNHYAIKDAWRVEPCRHQLIPPGSKPTLELTATEASILNLLAQNHPQHVSRALLVEGIGEDYRVYDDRRLEQIMSRLRKKIREGCCATPIKAVRGRGYVFTEPVELAV